MSLEDLSNQRPNSEQSVYLLGTVSPADMDLSARGVFNEDVHTYVLVEDGSSILLVYPGSATGLYHVHGVYVDISSDTEIPPFLYATELDRAWRIEEYGVSKEGWAVLSFYFAASLTAFIYETLRHR